MNNFVGNIGISGLGSSVKQTDKNSVRRTLKAADYYLPEINRGVYTTAPYSVTSVKHVPQNLNLYSPKLLLKVFANPSYVHNLINSNPELVDILKKYNLTEINTKNLLSIVDSHLTTTTAYALMIANNMGLSRDDKKILEQACIFHDFGKLLIPEEIINKPYGLTPEEKEIMDLHAELGYQLLKNTGLNERVLNLVRNHHKTVAENNDLLGQILSVADIYSALREKRVYKAPLPVNTAMDILDQKALNGEVSAEVTDSLKYSKLFRN